MRPYALIDLHCDTLTDCKYAAGNPDTLDDPKRVLSLSAIPDDVHWAQFFAIFIPDEKRGRAAIDYFGQNHRNFVRQMKRFSDRVSPCRGLGDMEAAFAQSKTAAFLTVENGSVLAGDLSRVRVLAEAGVCAITLVWNGENEIGSGHCTGHGLSAFGRAVIPDLPAGDLAMPTLIMKLLSPFWAGVFIAGPLAAIMSTVDSMLLLASAAIIKDLYIHYGLKGDASRMTPARLQTMSLVCTAVIGLIVFAAAIEPPDLLVWINLFAFGGLEAVFLWPIILGLYWKEANASGAVASIVAGVACFFALSILKPGMGGIHAIVPTSIVAFAAFVIGAKCGRPASEEVIRLFWGEGNGTS